MTHIILQGLGVACLIFTTGFLLAMGWHAGILCAAHFLGPHRHEHNYKVKVGGKS